MARGYVGINSRGKVYTGVSFSLKSNKSVSSKQLAISFVATIALISLFEYKMWDHQAHPALQLVPELTMADVWKNRATKEQAAKEGRRVLEVGQFDR